MLFRLAALFGRPAGELEVTLGSAELSEWIAFEQEYGIPDGYFVTGQVCATVAASLGGSKGVSPADFVPFFRRPSRAMSPAEIRNAFRSQLGAMKAQKAAGGVGVGVGSTTGRV